MLMNKTSQELDHIAFELDELGDNEFLEVFSQLAERHDIDIREKDSSSISKFTNWLSSVLYEIRDKEE